VNKQEKAEIEREIQHTRKQFYRGGEEISRELRDQLETVGVSKAERFRLLSMKRGRGSNHASVVEINFIKEKMKGGRKRKRGQKIKGWRY